MPGTRGEEESGCFLEQIKRAMPFRAWTAEASGACSKIHGPVRKGERRNASSGSCYVKQHTFNQEIVRTLFGSRSKEIEGGKKNEPTEEIWILGNS